MRAVVRSFLIIIVPLAGCADAPEPSDSATGDVAILPPSAGPNPPLAAKRPNEIETATDAKPVEPSNGAAEMFAQLVNAHRDGDPAAWEQAAARLGELRADAVPALAAGLASADPAERELAAMMLAGLGPDAAGAADALSAVLNDGSVYTRANACAALSHVEGTAARIVPVLTELLAADDPHVRQLAAMSLGTLGPRAADAMPALAAVANDENADVRAAATEAINSIRPTTAER